jgi:hypothetical protein
MRHSLTDRLATVTALILFLLAYVPLLVLSSHNHPSAADDYCFADTATRYGFWQAQIYYYNGWTGRYFSNMLVHGNPLVWGWYDGFRLIPALAVTGLLASLYSLVSEVLRDRTLRLRLISTGLLFYAVISGMHSTVEGFFWTAAVASYTVPTTLTLYLLAVLLRWYRLPSGTLKTLTTVWVAVLTFAIVGSGETNLILLLLILLAAGAYRLFFLRTFDWFLAGMVIVTLASAWLVFSAPGNGIRLGSNEQAGNIPKALVDTAHWLGVVLITSVLKTPLLPLSLLWLPVAVRLNRPESSVAFLFRVPLLLLKLVILGLLIVLIFPSTYGLGVAPGRVLNVAELTLLLGWFYALTVWVRWILQQNNQLAHWLTQGAPLPTWTTGLAGLWVIGSLAVSPTMQQFYTDLGTGAAATYDREMTARRQQLLAPTDTLHLTPISVHPASLFVDDIHTNSDHWWNRCQAQYYQHKVVILDEPSTTSAR